MSDWKFLERHRVIKPERTVPAQYVSSASDGFNGMFRFLLDCKTIRCVASDGGGWQHVSVSIEYETKPPTWDIMCKVKDLFWDAEEVVLQFHPPKSQYVNWHRGCLHLWRYTGGGPFVQPTPHWVLVGPK